MAINYSISKRPVTGHEDTQRVYATAQSDNSFSLNQFAEHIASHGSVYSRDVIAGVLMKAVDCMQEKLLEGYKVVLGDLGAFYITLSNKNWQELPEDPADYQPEDHVRRLTVNWWRGSKMRNLLSMAEFNLVANRKQQAALLAAVKAGETSVDLSGSTSSSSSSSDSSSGSDDTSTESGGSTDTGGDSNPL